MVSYLDLEWTFCQLSNSPIPTTRVIFKNSRVFFALRTTNPIRCVIFLLRAIMLNLPKRLALGGENLFGRQDASTSDIFKNPTKPMVFWKLLVFLTPGSREKVGLVEKSKTIDPNNQHDSGALLERYPEGQTRQGGWENISEACRARRKFLLFPPRAWNPSAGRLGSKQAISYLSHFSQAGEFWTQFFFVD